MVFEREPTETQTTYYSDFKITSEKGIEHGLFFRDPLSKKILVVNYKNCDTDAFQYIAKIKNPLFRLAQYLLGNRQVILNIEYMQSDETYFTNINILRSPVYFKRNYRRTEAINRNENGCISSIISHGICNEDCEATCVKEKTITTFFNGRAEVCILRNRAHCFTHLFNIAKIISADKGRIYNDFSNCDM